MLFLCSNPPVVLLLPQSKHQSPYNDLQSPTRSDPINCLTSAPVFSPPLLLPPCSWLFSQHIQHSPTWGPWHLLSPLPRTLLPQVGMHGSLLNFICLCSQWGLLWPLYFNSNPLLHPGTPSIPFLLYCSPLHLSPSAYYMFYLFFCSLSICTH